MATSHKKEARPTHGTKGQFGSGKFGKARFGKPDELLPKEKRPATTHTKVVRP